MDHRRQLLSSGSNIWLHVTGVPLKLAHFFTPLPLTLTPVAHIAFLDPIGSLVFSVLVSQLVVSDQT